MALFGGIVFVGHALLVEMFCGRKGALLLHC